MEATRVFGWLLSALAVASAVTSPNALADQEGAAYRGKMRCSDRKTLAQVTWRAVACHNEGKTRVVFGDWPPIPTLVRARESCKGTPDRLRLDRSEVVQMKGDKAIYVPGDWISGHVDGKLWTTKTDAWIVAEIAGDLIEKDGSISGYGGAQYAHTRTQGAYGGRIAAPDIPSLTVTKKGNLGVALNVLVCPIIFPVSYYAAAAKAAATDYQDLQDLDKALASAVSPEFGREISGRIAHDAPAGTNLVLALPNRRDADTKYVVYVESESRTRPIEYSISMPVNPTATSQHSK